MEMQDQLSELIIRVTQIEVAVSEILRLNPEEMARITDRLLDIRKGLKELHDIDEPRYSLLKKLTGEDELEGLSHPLQ